MSENADLGHSRREEPRRLGDPRVFELTLAGPREINAMQGRSGRSSCEKIRTHPEEAKHAEELERLRHAGAQKAGQAVHGVVPTGLSSVHFHAHAQGVERGELDHGQGNLW